MKNLLLLTISLMSIGCATPSYEEAPFNWKPQPEFDWMPHPLQWERNIRDCRSQPQCNAADLFDRVG